MTSSGIRLDAWNYLKWGHIRPIEEKDGKGVVGAKIIVDLMIKIRKELEDSDIGWDFRQVTDLIQKRTDVKYHEVHIYRLLHKWGFVPKVPQKRFTRTAALQDKKKFKKEYKRA
jgi:transposase